MRLPSLHTDWKIIGLVGVIHMSSHFFQLVLPTLYLSLAHDYGYDFTQLGLLVSTFFLVSCLGQASSGFVVDRIGGGPVMRFGLMSFVIAACLIAISDSYGTLLLAALIGGLGNSIFHPVDYAVLNDRVSHHRLGHAFSVHGFTGNLGWALTPVYMAFLIYLFNWRVAAFGAGALVAVILAMAWLGRDLLAPSEVAVSAQADETASPASVKAAEKASQEEAQTSTGSIDLSNSGAWQTLTILVSQPALLGAFLFFACTTIAMSSVQNYTIPMLGQVYGIDKVLAGMTLSSYMLLAAAGMLAGGFVAGANPKSERIVAISLVLAGAFLVVLATGWFPRPIAMALVALAGFCSGVSAPSRDMLIRRVTPKGATGTVYGLVYSGMDVGSSLGPFLFGFMLDMGLSLAPWIGAGMAFVAAAGFALWVAHAANAGATARPQTVAG